MPTSKHTGWYHAHKRHPINKIWERYRLKVCSCCSHFGLGHNNCAPLGPLSALFGRMFWNFIIASWALRRIILEMWGWRVLTKRFTNPDKSTSSSSSRIVVWEGTSADPPPSVKTGITQFTQVLQLFSICLQCDKYQCDKIWSDVAKVFLTSSWCGNCHWLWAKPKAGWSFSFFS